MKSKQHTLLTTFTLLLISTNIYSYYNAHLNTRTIRLSAKKRTI